MQQPPINFWKWQNIFKNVENAVFLCMETSRGTVRFSPERVCSISISMFDIDIEPSVDLQHAAFCFQLPVYSFLFLIFFKTSLNYIDGVL